jgi:glycosyltransferase involved in cell wall biosynthesis
VGGIPEIVTDGQCGIIVPPGDSESIAKAILFLKQNPELRRQMGNNSQQKVIHNFNIESTIKNTVSLFLQLHSKYEKP